MKRRGGYQKGPREASRIFASENPAPGRGPYKAAADSVHATANGLLTLSVPAPSSEPTCFVRIGASDSPVTGGTEL